MRRRISFMFLILLAVFSVSCSKVPYKSTFLTWTKGQNIYSPDTFVAKIIWNATYMSPEYCAIARQQINEWKKLPLDDVSEYPSYLTGDDRSVFLVSIYTPKGYPAINISGEKFWELTLDTESGSFKPSSIETVTVTEREAKLFLYINAWSNFYKITFPVNNINAPFSLALRSAGVSSFLDWK